VPLLDSLEKGPFDRLRVSGKIPLNLPFAKGEVIFVHPLPSPLPIREREQVTTPFYLS